MSGFQELAIHDVAAESVASLWYIAVSIVSRSCKARLDRMAAKGQIDGRRQHGQPFECGMARRNGRGSIKA